MLYALGRNANQLFSIDLQGTVSVLAGSGSPGNTDGSGEVAQFFTPNGIVIIGDGSKIYIVGKAFGRTGGTLNPVQVRVIEKK